MNRQAIAPDRVPPPRGAFRVLLVEDTAALATLLVKGLTEEGFLVHHAPHGSAARAAIGQQPCDIVLLDLGLPDEDGVDWLRWFRERGLLEPVLVLTAREAISSRVQVLEAGADDYLVKPMAFEELVARMRALLRRTAGLRGTGLELGELHLPMNRSEVLVCGRRVRLSPKEHALLEHLVRRRDEVVTRAELLGAVFNYCFDPGTNLVDVHMTHLRRKIAGSGVAIETLRGIGFRLSTSSGSGDAA